MQTQHVSPAPLSLSDRLRERWAAGIPCSSDVAFASGVSFIWLALYNVHFWKLSAAAMWHPNAGSAMFMASLGVFAWVVLALLLLMSPTRWIMRTAASVMFVIAAFG